MVEAAELMTSAMARFHGFVRAMDGDARAIPEVVARIRSVALQDVFDLVGDMCRSVHERAVWTATDVFPLCAPAHSLLMARGLILGETAEGDEVAAFQPPGSSVAH